MNNIDNTYDAQNIDKLNNKSKDDLKEINEKNFILIHNIDFNKEQLRGNNIINDDQNKVNLNLNEIKSLKKLKFITTRKIEKTIYSMKLMT